MFTAIVGFVCLVVGLVWGMGAVVAGLLLGGMAHDPYERVKYQES